MKKMEWRAWRDAAAGDACNAIGLHYAFVLTLRQLKPLNEMAEA
jgi:hypothetical protein